MKVFYSTAHQDHNPEREFTSDGLVPYPETAHRVEAITTALNENGSFDLEFSAPIDPTALTAIHDADYLTFLAEVYTESSIHSAELVATTYARGAPGRRPSDRKAQMGYYGFDTTPITPGTWAAALAAAGSALKGAENLQGGASQTYALCRPPGHHAGRNYFGGYCYLNNAALAAAHLAAEHPVAILDIDYHHGNGTQDIFYESAQVLFVSIHADPANQYPLYWGYADEYGRGDGEGLTRNFPLPPQTNDSAYLQVLDEALACIADFDPEYLIVSAGVDIYREDPLGDWEISLAGIAEIGTRIADAGHPTLLVQEGGYALAELGTAIRTLLIPFSSREDH